MSTKHDHKKVRRAAAVLVLMACTNGASEGQATSGASEEDTIADGSSTSSSTSDEESSESTEEGESSSSTTTTAGPADCREEPCTEPGSAFCNEAGECVSCEEASTGDDVCLAFDARIPACNANGECVACTAENLGACEGQTPLCNAEAFTCEGCTWHEQCPADAPSIASAGCNMVSGACLLTDNVLEVDADGGAAFFPSITAALNDAGEEATIIVHAGATPYVENVIITGARTIALIAALGEDPRLQGDGSPGLTISGDATVFVQGLRIAGNQNGLGVRINGAETAAYIDRSHVVGNSTGGIEVTGGATLTLRNSFVQGPTERDAVVVNDSSLEIVYSTLGGNYGNTVNALTCTAQSTVSIRNSVVVSRGGASAVDCPPANIITSFVADTSTDPAFDAGWFGTENNGYNEGNFHISATHPFGDVAAWVDGDPIVDIDGEDRPNVNEARDVAGADVPSP